VQSGNLPLSNIRVIDLTRVLSGPFCTMLLADFGADVIKIEAPEGDPIRKQDVADDGLSWYFASFNRNKRSITLDLKTASGRAVLERLIADADVLVDNFRPGVLDRLGFAAERLREIRPNLITCSITGFGADGPYRDRPCFDFIAQAMSGFMSVNGGPLDPPLRTGLPITDLIAGLHGALGVMAALLRNERAPGEVGREHVDISLVNSMISLLAYTASHYFASGEVLKRTGNDHPITSPYGLFRTRDDPIAIAPSDDVFFARLMKALDMEELIGHPDFATATMRLKHRAQINLHIENRLRTDGASHWIAVLNAASVPCGPVNDVARVFSDPQIQQQEMTVDVDHPGYGTVRMLGFPIKFTEAPSRIRMPAPRQGEHTAEILEEIGYSEDERAELRRSGAIGENGPSEDLDGRRAAVQGT
jgi:CoA:oxalate CoA-transferase